MSIFVVVFTYLLEKVSACKTMQVLSGVLPVCSSYFLAWVSAKLLLGSEFVF